ncbi:MAG: phage holin family protein [Acidobacteriia bacterium]|nr:phage holin family protein [Terriglobia bacterium]
MKMILHLLINAAALWVAVRLIPGITYHGGPVPLLGVALVFGVLNVLVKPLATLFSLPFVVLTLGLFLLVINALMLWLTSALSGTLGLRFHVAGFVSALLGSIVVSFVSMVLSAFVKGEGRG